MLEGYVGVDGSGGGDGVPPSSVAEPECSDVLSANWTPLGQKYDVRAFRSRVDGFRFKYLLVVVLDDVKEGDGKKKRLSSSAECVLLGGLGEEQKGLEKLRVDGCELRSTSRCQPRRGSVEESISGSGFQANSTLHSVEMLCTI